MAAPVINTTRTVSGTGVTTLETASFTPGGANKGLLVFVACADGTPPTVNDVKFGSTAGVGGTSFGAAIDTHTAEVYLHVAAFALIAPSGSGTVWAEFSGTASECGLAVYALEDLNQSVSFGTLVKANGNTVADTLVTVSGNANDLLLDFLWRVALAQTQGSGQTAQFQVNGIGSVLTLAGSSRAGGAAQPFAWHDTGGTVSNWEWIAMGIAAKEVTAGGGTTVTPTNASLSYAGQTPTILARATVEPTTSSLSYVGLTPVLYTTNVVPLTNASLSFVGLTPNLVTQHVLTPTNASLSFVGLTPVLYTTNIVALGNASLSFVGLTPTVIGDNGTNISPENASLSFQGLQPSLILHATLTPDNASLSFQGMQPTINTSGTIRGHANTGRRWRGRVYGLSYSDETVVIPTVGFKPEHVPAPPAPRIGLGALAPHIAYLPPRPVVERTLLPERDVDDEAVRKREVRRRRAVKAAKALLDYEDRQVAQIESAILQLIDYRSRRKEHVH